MLYQKRSLYARLVEYTDLNEETKLIRFSDKKKLLIFDEQQLKMDGKVEIAFRVFDKMFFALTW